MEKPSLTMKFVYRSECPDQHSREQNDAHGHVDAVEAGQAEKNGAVNTRSDGETLVDDEIRVLVRMSAEKAQPESDRDDEPALELIAIIAANGTQIGRAHVL